MANAVSFGQRRGMGQKYSVDPALVLERKRIEEEYANAPIAESRRRFNEQLAFEKDKAADANRGSMMASGINAATLYGYGKGQGWWSGNTPAVQTTAFNPALETATPTTGTAYGTSLGTPAITGNPAFTGVTGETALTGGTTAAESGTALTGSSLGVGTNNAVLVSETAPMATGGGVSAGSGTVGGATLGSTTQGAMAFYGGAKLGGLAGEAIGEAIGVGGKTERQTAGGAASGMMMGGPGGAIIGSLINFVESKICLIVTVCTNRHSYEVEIAREYRDAFMDADQLRGYYALAEQIVPRIEDSDRLRKFFKKYLVNRLVDYGEYKLGKKDRKPEVMSCIVSKGFLGACKMIGKILPIYIRANGEVY